MLLCWSFLTRVFAPAVSFSSRSGCHARSRQSHIHGRPLHQIRQVRFHAGRLCPIFEEKKNYPQNVSVEISSTFTEIQQKAKRKAADLAKISLKDLLNLLNEAGKDAGTQFLHIILYTLCGFFMYLFSDIFFSKDPDYAISIIGLILSLPILYFLSKKNFL